MVRPLPVITSAENAREFVLAQPALDDDSHRANFILKSWRIDAGGVEIMPLMQVIIRHNAISGYLQTCEDDIAQVHLVNGTDVTNQVLCDELPCTEGTTNANEALSYLRNFINSLVTNGYEVDEFMYENRGYGTGAKVDAIIDT